MKKLNADTAIITTLLIVSGAIYAGSWQASLSSIDQDFSDERYDYRSCENGECDDHNPEVPCYTIDCPAPPEGCWYDNPQFDRECQVSCGHLKCEGQEDRTEKEMMMKMKMDMDMERGMRMDMDMEMEKKGEIHKLGCSPIVCEDGTGHPRCTPEGHPINYFADPCFKPSALEVCYYNDRKYQMGEQFKDADDCNTCYCAENGNIACTKMYCGDRTDSQPKSYDSNDPDHGCYSSQDCGPETVCSIEFGDCKSSPCLPGQQCSPEPCTGFCMRKEFAFPETLSKCETSQDCSNGRICTKPVERDCLEECPLSDEICMAMCGGRCIISDIDGVEDDWQKDDRWKDAYEPDDYNDWQNEDQWDDRAEPEYEEEVRTAPVMSRFNDVTSQTLEGEAANALAQKNIIGGFPDGSFRGDQSVNRAEAAKFLLMSRLGVKNDVLNNGRFADVLEGEWYVKYVVTAAELGIIDGYKDRTFRPGNTVNTAEFLKMLTGAFDLPQDVQHTFTDVPHDAWFAKYAGAADAFNLFPSRPVGTLQPEKLLTRGEVSIAIYRILNAQ